MVHLRPPLFRLGWNRQASSYRPATCLWAGCSQPPLSRRASRLVGRIFVDACMGRDGRSRLGNCMPSRSLYKMRLLYSILPAWLLRDPGRRPRWSYSGMRPRLLRLRVFALPGFAFGLIFFQTSHFTNDLIVIMTISTFRS